MTVNVDLKGPRLAYVLRKLSGTVHREISVFDKKTMAITKKLKSVDAGYMLFLPTGQSYRLTEKEVKRRGFNKQPTIIGFAEANDTKTAAGRFKLAVGVENQKIAWQELEDNVVKLTTNKVGTIENAVANYPTEELEAAALDKGKEVKNVSSAA